jgi:integrase
MSHPINLLTNLKCKQSKCPKDKPYIYLNDGLGLRLRVTPTSKYWVLRGKLNNKSIQVGFGSYPVTTLEQAREMREVSRKQIKQGIHPKDYFKGLKNANLKKSSHKFMFGNLFNDMVEYYLNDVAETWSEAHTKRTRGIYRNYLEKSLKDQSILTLTDSDYLSVLKNIKSNPIKLVSGKTNLDKYPRTSTMILAKTVINLVYQFAREERNFKGDNPIDLIRKNKVFKKGKVISHKPVHEDDLGAFWSAVHNLPKVQDRLFLIIDTLTALRVSSLRNAKWSWFNQVRMTLNIPAQYMKGNDDFVTPLPQYVVDLLKDLKKQTNADMNDFIFTNRFGEAYDLNRPRKLIKENLGFSYATAHGSRTILKMMCLRFSGMNNVVIETQLSHTYGDKTERAYMGEYDWLNERIDLVEWLMNFLEEKRKVHDKVLNLAKEKASSETAWTNR